MTYREAIYGILSELKRQLPTSDIKPANVLFWLRIAINAKKVEMVSTAHPEPEILSIFSPIQVGKDNIGKFIDIPLRLLSGSRRSPIESISYNESGECGRPGFSYYKFDETTFGAVASLYYDKETTPSAQNPYFYRVGQMVNDVSVNRAYLLGIECVDVKNVLLAAYVSKGVFDVCNLDDQIDIPVAYEKIIIDDVLQHGRYMMMIPDEISEQANDGDDSTNNIYRGMRGIVPGSQSQQQ